MKRNRLRLWLTILVVVVIVFLLIVGGMTARAVSGMPEFGEILGNNLNAFIELLKNNLKILELIW